MQPTVSQATIFLTSALALAILTTLSASAIATMVGSPSGTQATISTMAVTNRSDMPANVRCPAEISFTSDTTNVRSAAPMPKAAMRLPSFFSFS